MNNFLCKLLIITCVLNTSVCYAQQDVVSLNLGDKAPFTGYLFDKSKEQQLRLDEQNLNYYKSLSESLSNINKAQEDNLSKMEDRISIRDHEIDNLSKRASENDNSLFTKAGFFILGCLVTGFVSYGVYKSK